MSPELLAAFRAAHYLVSDLPEPFALQIDQQSSELAALHNARGVTSSAFITAWNPSGQMAPEAQNLRAQQQLVAQLAACGHSFVNGSGKDPADVWPGEPSVLVLGMGREEAMRIGRAFRQLAIVWCGADAVPGLVLLESPQYDVPAAQQG